MDIILSYMDEIYPTKAPASLYKEIKNLRAIKMSHPKGGLLPYQKSREIELIIKAQSEPFSFVQNFNRASSFKQNRIAAFAY